VSPDDERAVEIERFQAELVALGRGRDLALARLADLRVSGPAQGAPVLRQAS
jgi:hypothetical protein